MRKVPKASQFVLALALISPLIVVAGCGGKSGPVELGTYEPVTAEEQKIVEEKKERLRDEPRG